MTAYTSLLLVFIYGGLAQLVERQLCKLNVRSSILLTSKCETKVSVFFDMQIK